MTKQSKRQFKEGRVCACCGSKEDLTIDHIVPKVFGGLLVPGNRQVLCVLCNRNKGILAIDYETKTFIVYSWLFRLEDEDRKRLFEETYKVSTEILNPRTKLCCKYQLL
jgi:hypothetical protein